MFVYFEFVLEAVSHLNVLPLKDSFSSWSFTNMVEESAFIFCSLHGNCELLFSTNFIILWKLLCCFGGSSLHFLYHFDVSSRHSISSSRWAISGLGGFSSTCKLSTSSQSNLANQWYDQKQRALILFYASSQLWSTTIINTFHCFESIDLVPTIATLLGRCDLFSFFISLKGFNL